VLSGLIRRIAPDAAVSRTGDAEAFEAAVAKAAGDPAVKD
jgi:hypothetical protein